MNPSSTEEAVPLRCGARTHAKVWGAGRRIFTHRCTDPRCEDYVFAEMNDLVAIHRWDMDHPDPNRDRKTFFEPKRRSRRGRMR